MVLERLSDTIIILTYFSMLLFIMFNDYIKLLIIEYYISFSIKSIFCNTK